MYRCSDEGQRDGKSGSLSRYAANGDMAAVQFHNRSGDGEAQSRAARVTRTGRIGAIETVKDMRLYVFWQTFAGVLDT